ncbi:MAG: protein kinase [Chloroflexota bacterium]
MSKLRLFLFGAPKLELDGDVIEMPRRKMMALLTYLVVTQQPHRRDTLASLFWPDSSQKAARTALRRELHLLKKMIGDEWVESTREVVELHSDAGLWIDIEEFRSLVEKKAAEQGDPIEQLVQAVELVRGDFLAGFALSDCPEFDEWQFFEADDLRRKYAFTLETLAQHYQDEGEFDLAIVYARRWLALDPMHEPVHRELMRLFALASQQAAAVRQYEECVRILNEELDVPPEPETNALYEAIRTRRYPSHGQKSGRERDTDTRIEEVAAARETQRPSSVSLSTSPTGRYLTDNLLATGGHGEVYLGRDTETETPVVIKRLKPDVVQGHPEFVQRFKRESEVLRELDHPNIVKMLATFEYEGQQNIVMEYVSGGSLRDLLNQEPSLPLKQALKISLEVADALSRSHHVGIIHRDIKPANVLLGKDGSPRLTDFGIARLIHDDVRLTQSGALLGSPAYASPELLNDEALDTRTDIWSFGVLLYEMLAGQPPFVGRTITALITGIMNKRVPPIDQLRPGTPPLLNNLLQRMLAKDRNVRLDSMRFVAAESHPHSENNCIKKESCQTMVKK